MADDSVGAEKVEKEIAGRRRLFVILKIVHGSDVLLTKDRNDRFDVHSPVSFATAIYIIYDDIQYSFTVIYS